MTDLEIHDLSLQAKQVWDIGGWVNVWDNPQRIMEQYKSLTHEIIHPSRLETQQMLESDKSATQINIFELE